MQYSDVVDLVEDAEIFSIDPEDYIYLDEAVTIGGKEYLTGKYIGPAAQKYAGAAKDALKSAGTTIGNKAQSLTSRLPDQSVAKKVADTIAANPQTTAMALGISAAVIALAGAVAIVKYLNSIGRLKKLSELYAKKASSAATPEQKAKFTAKAQKYAQKLKLAQAKARVKKGAFIEQTKQMKQKYDEMKKSGADAKKLASLQKKLDARNKVLAKIGAI